MNNERRKFLRASGQIVGGSAAAATQASAPFGEMKEQTSGPYAQHGFITPAYDASYQAKR